MKEWRFESGIIDNIDSNIRFQIEWFEAMNDIIFKCAKSFGATVDEYRDALKTEKKFLKWSKNKTKFDSEKIAKLYPDFKEIVDQVSTSNLYDLLNDLTGENSVTIGGEIYTINTRYSPEMMCRRAGQFIKEQFEGLGLAAEYDYFNFRTNMKSIIFPFDDQEGWAVGKRTTVIHTEDGGDLWVEDSYDDEAGLNDIVMWSRTHGCVVGNNGIIKVTNL